MARQIDEDHLIEWGWIQFDLFRSMNGRVENVGTATLPLGPVLGTYAWWGVPTRLLEFRQGAYSVASLRVYVEIEPIFLCSVRLRDVVLHGGPPGSRLSAHVLTDNWRQDFLVRRRYRQTPEELQGGFAMEGQALQGVRDFVATLRQFQDSRLEIVRRGRAFADPTHCVSLRLCEREGRPALNEPTDGGAEYRGTVYVHRHGPRVRLQHGVRGT